jgi:hypothetical protein
MEVIGDTALAEAAPHADALHSAALRNGWLSDEAPPFAGFADAGFLDHALPFDDEYPDSFPEDPFPELLFERVPPNDALFGDGVFEGPFDDGASRAAPALPNLDDGLTAAAGVFLKTDLTADGPGLIDQIRTYENIKAMIAGRQARLAVEFEARQRQEQTEPVDATPVALSAEDPGKKRPKEPGPGVAEQIALARGESPHRGGRLLGMAKALVLEMPHTLTALDTGRLNEERAMYFVKETACLTVQDRTAVDEELAADTGTFDGVGTRSLIAAVKAAATRRDPRSVTQRASHAASERGVSLRPAPDCMTYLTALLPADHGVAAYTALTRHADTLKSAGDPRSLAQIKADTLLERTTGTPGGFSGIEINLVMTDRTLLQADTEPARLTGYGTVPAKWARELIHPDQDQDQEPEQAQELNIWIRRLYTAPDTGDLVAMDSK